MSLDLHQLDLDSQALIRKVSRFVRREFEHFSYEDVEFKRENDPFTYVDVTTEQMLKEGCQRLIPGCGFVNEESKNEPSDNGYVWIIDPIDGTSNFTHGVAHFSISVALAKDNEVVLGYVYEPMQDRMFHAIKGHGAWLNDRSLQVSRRSELKAGLIATGFPYERFDWLGDYLRVVTDIMDHAHGIRRMGSAALDMAYVAAGWFDGFFEFNLNAWDIAAGSLLVQEAGGRVTGFDGSDDYLFGKHIVGSSGRVHEELLAVMQRHDIVKDRPWMVG
jgi:myo-inositol-1(or 4)-monophosphatase